ncbi:MAG: HAD family hydrolase [Firmicutes bacterium]|nr:HAD family hydrolase [Bacillota bacterium]MBQ3112703.1 HAD family hydrolase [Bacillota bacterium]
MYDYILFDLDGTLTDPVLGITNSVAYALNKFGITVNDRSELHKFIGPPLIDSFMGFYGMSREDAEQATAYYRENFRAGGMFENEVYPGIPELLAELQAQGKKIILATSKPEEFAVKILQHFDLAQYFDFMGGASMDGTRSHKADVIAYSLEMGQVSDRSRAVMIGDREYDILGAKQFGLDSVGVLFGYGSRAELEAAGATHIVATVAELLPLLVK